MEEIPGMVKLDAPQLGELVLPILGTENAVDCGCRKDSGGANSDSNELAVLVSDVVENVGDESGHGVCEESKAGSMTLPQLDHSCHKL